jgi:hypothetical protein
MRLPEADRGVGRLIKKLQTLAEWAKDFSADDCGRWLAYDIPLTPKELYGYGSVYNPFMRLFQDRDPNDIDLILVTEEMNLFQRQRHMWCSDDRWRRSRPCISCAETRMGEKLSWFIKKYVKPNATYGPGLKTVIGDISQDEDIKSGLIRKDQVVLLWKYGCQEPTPLANATSSARNHRRASRKERILTP